MMSAASAARTARRYEVLGALPFVLVHVSVAGALWSGVTLEAAVVAIVAYLARMFFVTAGYHRYFSHRTFKTSRVGQFLLAFLAQTSSQKGVLWWAAHHRRHHKYSDQPGDVHSPRQDGLWYAHVGWIFNHTAETEWARVRDFAHYPELRLLNRFWAVPPFLLAAGIFAVWGWPGLFIGFSASTVALWHGSFVVNSLAHVVGKRRFATGDDSRNSFWLALLTLGEGWHNNHHRYMGSARQGFYWWEIDVTYYMLRLLALAGLVWDVREPPAGVLAEGRRRRPSASAAGLPPRRRELESAPASDAGWAHPVATSGSDAS